MNPQFAARQEEAEKCILSALRISLLQVGSLATSLGLSREHFNDPTRARVFESMMLAWTDGVEIDTFLLLNRLRDQGLSADAEQSVLDQIHHCPTAHNAESHIRTLLACHAARQAYALGQRLVAEAFEVGSEGIAGLLEQARAELEGVVVEPEPEEIDLGACLRQALDDMMAAEDDANNINFGLGLDETAGPFLRGDLIVIAGATGGGKSALAGNILENIAAQGFKGALFGLEMTRGQYAERMIASQGRVNVRDYKLSRRRMQDRSQVTAQQDIQIKAMHRAISAMAKWKVRIVTKCSSIGKATAKARQIKARGGLDVSVFDYAQLFDGIRGESDSREREVASISKALKQNAMDLGTINILLSQLNDDGRLRESRALGQDANTVLFIDGNADLIRVGKARSAPPGAEIKVRFTGAFTRFEAAV